jgi:hypothetical protein
MTGRTAAALALVGSVAAAALAFYLRMDAAYGPLRLSLDPGDWAVLWDLWRHGQIAPGVVAEGTALAAAAATVPWLLFAWRARRRGPR